MKSAHVALVGLLAFMAGHFWSRGPGGGPATVVCPPNPAGGGCDLAGKYDLSHLTQPREQKLLGPIQDDEALFLYAIVRGLRFSSVLEIGGLRGYSARNFLQAMKPTQGIMYTVDIQEVPPVHPTRHKTILKDVRTLEAADVDNKPVDLIFFDAHLVEPQMEMFDRLEGAGLISNSTVLAFHDTHLWPYAAADWAIKTPDGFMHRSAERDMVTIFKQRGWDAFMLHPTFGAMKAGGLAFRHGMVVMQRYTELKTTWE